MKMLIHIILISTLLIESYSQIQCSFGAISNVLYTADSFVINSVLCSEDDMMYIDIEYPAYINNWFGIVFSADMAGYALCYTTGQDPNIETTRQLALYQYTLTNTDRTATYNPSNDWIKVSETINNGIRIIYKKELSSLPYSVSLTSSIPLSYAWGEGTLVLNDHDANGGENKNDYILTFTITPTSSPTTSVPTTSIPTTLSIPTTAHPSTSVPTTSIPTFTLTPTPSPTTSVPTSIPTTAHPSTSMPTTSIPTTNSPSTSVPTLSRVEICTSGGVKAWLNVANKLQIYGTLCDDNMIYIDIMYSDFNDNYFGIVFDSDDMYGDALIYTTGKSDEIMRNEALYAYNMKETSSRADGVVYLPDDNWIEVLTNETNGGINVIYKKALSDTPWNIATESIKIGYAIGSTLVLDRHDERNNANAAYTLRFTKETTAPVPTTATTTTAHVPTTATTTGTTTDISNKGCEKQDLVETTATLDAFTVTLDINCDYNTVDVTIVYTEYNNNWFGIVFNDKMIGNTLVYTTGKSSETTRDVALYPYTNEGYGINNVLYNGAEYDWTKISETIENGVLSVHFQQHLDKTEIFSLETEEVYFKWAKGDNSLDLSQHAEGSSGRAEKSQKMDLLTGETTVVKDNLTLEITHGILMWLAWAVFASIGIMSSAFRFLYPNGPIWFYVHQGMQICVISLHIIAFMIALVFTERNGKPHFNNSHAIIGLVVTILCVIQPINALFRAHPPAKGWPNGVKSSKRIVWEFIHKMFGYVAWILGCVAAMLGMLLIGEVILAYIHMFLWCGLLLIIHIILYVVKITRAKKEGQIESVNTKENSGSDGHESEDPMLDTNTTKQ